MHCFVGNIPYLELLKTFSKKGLQQNLKPVSRRCFVAHMVYISTVIKFFEADFMCVSYIGNICYKHEIIAIISVHMVKLLEIRVLA